MAYADITLRDPNPIKRWLQRRRFADAVRLLSSGNDRNELRILDFGAGDGELIRQIVLRRPVQACVYEPTPRLRAEAEDKLAGVPGVTFADRAAPLPSESFDFVFCLEVFEHLPPKETAEALSEIHRLLKPYGFAAVGVPHELFLPALLKGLFRMSRRYGQFDASPPTVLAALAGRPPQHRPVSEISPGFAYHSHHLGFDYRVLERKLEDRFRLVRKWFSPFPILGSILNSEVYFLLQKADSEAGANVVER